MKEYEIFSEIKVPKNSNIIVRLDGRSFHTLARDLNLTKPYDVDFYKAIAEVSKDMFNEFSPLFIYAFSDEISILLNDLPFNGRVEKINSVLASFASSSFVYMAVFLVLYYFLEVLLLLRLLTFCCDL